MNSERGKELAAQFDRDTMSHLHDLAVRSRGEMQKALRSKRAQGYCLRDCVPEARDGNLLLDLVKVLEEMGFKSPQM